MTVDDIRKDIMLLEGTTTTINEAPMGFLKQLVKGAAGLFSDVAAGELQIGQAANKWYRYYLFYLGKIGKKPDASTIGDLFTFLMDNGLKPQAVFTSITQGMSDERVKIADMEDIKNYWNTAIVTDAKGKLGKTFLIAMQEHAKLGDQSTDDLLKQATVGSQVAATAAKAAGVSPSTAAAAQPTAASTTPATTAPILSGLPTGLADILSKDPGKSIRVIDKLLKKLEA